LGSGAALSSFSAQSDHLYIGITMHSLLYQIDPH